MTALKDYLREQIRLLRGQEERKRKQREALEQTLAALSAGEAYLSNVARETTPPPPADTRTESNREIIAAILRDRGRPLRTVEIARHAEKLGLIHSPKGHPGVYGIVQTVLERNRKSTFIKIRPGTWDLQERRARHERKILSAREKPKHPPNPRQPRETFQIVMDFYRAHPGRAFSATAIATQIGLPSGAVRGVFARHPDVWEQEGGQWKLRLCGELVSELP